MQKALTQLVEHIEIKNITPTENQESDLINLFVVWKNEIVRVCQIARSTAIDESIF